MKPPCAKLRPYGSRCPPVFPLSLSRAPVLSWMPLKEAVYLQRKHHTLLAKGRVSKAITKGADGGEVCVAAAYQRRLSELREEGGRAPCE